MEETLNKIAIIAKRNNIKAYVVGGAVRDTLLGRKDFGIDITIEGNGMEFAKILQKEFGGLLRQHSKFGTASLIFNKRTIDIASCREEKYPGVAELPKVKMCTFKEDLKRRDFTINTLAWDLETKELIDLFNGRKDLDAKLIRVLHPKSFVDDPTRIFRALRFAGKLGFRLEPVTKSLALDAIKKGFIEKLSPKRIRDQIILILKESDRQKILELMYQFGIFKHIGLKLPEVELFRNIDKNLIHNSRFTIHDSRIGFVYLLGIIELKNPPKFLTFTRRELQKIDHVHTILAHLSKLESAQKPSEVYDLLYPSGNEELLFIASTYPKLKPKILKFLKVYKKVKLSISGKDLSQLGIKKGPLYKELLSTTLYAKLDGKVQGKKEELEFVKSRAS